MEFFEELVEPVEHGNYTFNYTDIFLPTSDGPKELSYGSVSC